MQAEQGRKLKDVEDLPTRTQVMIATVVAKNSSTVIINKNDKIESTDDVDVTNIIDGLAELHISAGNNLNRYNSNDDDDDDDNSNF